MGLARGAGSVSMLGEHTRSTDGPALVVSFESADKLRHACNQMVHGYFSNLFDNENKQTANRQIHLYLVTGVSEISAISLFNTAKK